MISHRNIRSNVEATNQVFPSGPRFRPLSILPLSHLLEQTAGLLLPLRGGARIAYATALQPAAIQRDMAEYRVTTMVLVPRILSLFMDSIERTVKRQGKERVWNLMCRISEHLPRRVRRVLFRRVIQSFGGRLDFLVTGGAPLEAELEHKWELIQVLADVVGRPADELTPETKLKDLDLDAVGRIQLERVVEDRLGKFIDDSRIGQDTTVGDLEPLLSSQNREHLYPLWPFSRSIRFVRSLAQMPIFGAISVINRPLILRRDHLEGLEPPAIFVMDYDSILDAPFALGALPGRIRQRVGISTTWKTDHTTRWVGTMVALFFNSFRYSPSGSLHATLVHASGLLDHRWSILFLVRAHPATNGSVASIHRSIGLLAAEFGVPVVPIHITGLERHMPLLGIPYRDSVTVRFGEPITCKPGMGYRDVEAALEAAR